MASLLSDDTSYFIPYKTNSLFIRYFKPKNGFTNQDICFLLVHWMDSRGHKGNSIYEKLGNYFANKGIPVFLFDQLGSGQSKGTFEFPQKMKDQIKIVYAHLIEKLNQENNNPKNWTIIPIIHSITAISIMGAINDGLPIHKLIWLGGPPSHGVSITRSIKKEGKYFQFRLAGTIDNFSGLIGKPITKKMFGFKLRLRDMNKYLLHCHGARMMKPHTEMDILAIFGSKDEYMVQQDIDDELPAGKYEHIKRIIIENATHSFENHTEKLLELIENFIK